MTTVDEAQKLLDGLFKKLNWLRKAQADTDAAMDGLWAARTPLLDFPPEKRARAAAMLADLLADRAMVTADQAQTEIELQKALRDWV